MKYLTTEHVLTIHAQIMQTTVGEAGVRDVGLIESAVARPRATFGGEELYHGVFTKAGALMHSLLRNHPFVDGNKRTATVAAGIFPEYNGWQLTATNAELEAFVLHAVEARLDAAEIEMWLEGHAEPAVG
ncbi:MAG TPA: type II toxin-antitoxin system death-on-curing family toxin [Ardenticatenaceae bacterium]|nr:type II toxin-antitoxin system death-on-curing family toxin [Ardenticatenaceae bacterium]